MDYSSFPTKAATTQQTLRKIARVTILQQSNVQFLTTTKSQDIQGNGKVWPIQRIKLMNRNEIKI